MPEICSAGRCRVLAAAVQAAKAAPHLWILVSLSQSAGNIQSPHSSQRCRHCHPASACISFSVQGHIGNSQGVSAMPCVNCLVRLPTVASAVCLNVTTQACSNISWHCVDSIVKLTSTCSFLTVVTPCFLLLWQCRYVAGIRCTLYREAGGLQWLSCCIM